MPPGETATNHFRIRELSIKNFRGITDLTLTVPPSDEEGGLIVLAGDNGCGKTSVLEALLFLLSRENLLPVGSASTEEQIFFGAQKFELTATFEGPFPESSSVRFDGGSFTARRDSDDSFSVRDRLRSDGMGIGGYPDLSGVALWSRFDPNVEYFSTHREPKPLAGSPSTNAQPPSDESSRIADLKRRLISAYYRQLREHRGGVEGVKLNGPFERIQQFLVRFLQDGGTLDVFPISNNPGSGDELVWRYGEIPSDITSLAMAREAAAKGRALPTIVPIDRFSSGQLALFAFAGRLIFRDRPADVVLIDEPEQHMHPQWQRLLLGALRELSPTTQFVVATHSLEILNSALSTERFLLLRDNDPRAKAWKVESKEIKNAQPRESRS